MKVKGDILTGQNPGNANNRTSGRADAGVVAINSLFIGFIIVILFFIYKHDFTLLGSELRSETLASGFLLLTGISDPRWLAE